VPAGTSYFIAVIVILKPQLVLISLLIFGMYTPGRVSLNNAVFVPSGIPASSQVIPPSVVFSIII